MTNPEPIRHPSAKAVEDFHKNADTDRRAESAHHTIGNGRTNAAAGDHNHQAGNGAAIMDGIIITGIRSSGLAGIVNQLLDALEVFGLDNQTTP